MNIDMSATRAGLEPIQWVLTNEERYYEMLGVLPPASMGSNSTTSAFQVGEAFSHRDGLPTFDTYKATDEAYFVARNPTTFKEFRAEFPNAEYYYG